MAGLITGIAVVGTAGSALALQSMSCATSKEAANDCKARGCETNLANNLSACAELPPNRSCLVMAKEQKYQCDQYCDDYAAKQAAAKAGCTEK